MFTLGLDAALGSWPYPAARIGGAIRVGGARPSTPHLDLGSLHVMAPEQQAQVIGLLAGRGVAHPATFYDGRQGGVLNLMQRAHASSLPSTTSAASWRRSWILTGCWPW